MPPKKVETKTSKPAAKPAGKLNSTKTGATKQGSTSKTTSKPTDKKKEEAAPVKAAIEVESMPIKQLGKVLAPDPGHNWCKSGKWPCLLDPSTTAGTFLRYRDTNFLQAVSPKEMEADRIRKALLGGLRYGKPLVIDLGEIDRFDMITTQINNIQDGLMEKILNKSILQVENFETLVKEEDGDEYKPDKFTGGMADQFVFLVIIAGEVPPPDASNKMFYILVN
ncbi:IQ motif and ankyrin repeat domain-containing protein 1-like [Mytilus edulis]|uniref:IQ motif and ankyrin repeat domain-containing protein 1-like n=1 Tax=Mytilus edulis TaxID=6550 RepID=UPI0039EEB8FE